MGFRHESRSALIAANCHGAIHDKCVQWEISLSSVKVTSTIKSNGSPASYVYSLDFDLEPGSVPCLPQHHSRPNSLAYVIAGGDPSSLVGLCFGTAI